jgi:hypothetical protein
MRNVAAATFTLLLFVAVVSAQVPTAGNVFFGYSYYHTNVSNIGPDFVNPAGTCAIGAVCGGTVSTRIYQALFGPRISVSLGKFRPFGEFEFGVGHTNTQNIRSDTSFAVVASQVGHEPNAGEYFSFERSFPSVEARGAYQNNIRLSTGIVLRF